MSTIANISAVVLLLLSAAGVGAQQDRGRPIVLLLHGRGMLDRDTAATRKLWGDALIAGLRGVTSAPPMTDRDVRVVWYADVLDPRSALGCEYTRTDPRAKRERTDDQELKGFVSMVGNFLGALTTMASDSESGSELRSLAADAAFLSDGRKRCASENRLAVELDRARQQGRPVVLIAHSLGSLVAYDYLSSRSDSGVVQRLITIGSPVGSPKLRRLLIGGDSTDAFVRPASVVDWVNIHHQSDPFAATLSIGRDVVATQPADEPDAHEMVGYLRGGATAREVLAGWCASLAPTGRPESCRSSPMKN
jgi:pimeloyl-ACP methyl ester carboxylesterase